LNVIKNSRADGERSGWKGRALLLSGKNWDEFGAGEFADVEVGFQLRKYEADEETLIDDPYPPHLRPMEPLLTRQSIRETRFLLSYSTAGGQYNALNDRLKMRGVPGDLKSAIRLMDVTDLKEDVIEAWKGTESHPKKTESQLL
jgi:hypothetical protein